MQDATSARVVKLREMKPYQIRKLTKKELEEDVSLLLGAKSVNGKSVTSMLKSELVEILEGHLKSK